MKLFIWVISIAVSLLSGYIDIPFSLTRVVVFYPFFLAGYLFKNQVLRIDITRKLYVKRIWEAVLGLVLIFGTFVAKYINTEVFFSYQSYSGGVYGS
jgi:fucose 4-O-acetylase-like acetyltransferase